MNKKWLFLGMALQLLCASFVGALLDDLKIIELKDGRQIMLGFDAYKTGTIQDNQLQGTALLVGILKLALANPTKHVDFSFEDPGVYIAGNILTHMAKLEEAVDRLPPSECFIGLAAKEGSASFDSFAFSKPQGMTSFLCGDLTLASILLNKQSNVWPKNLVIRSNDPRQEHYLALTNNIDWMKQNGDSLLLSDFITPAWSLRTKELNFYNSSLSDNEKEALFKKISILRQTVQEQMEGFANFLALKSGVDFSVDEVRGMTIKEAQEKIELIWVHEFLAQCKKKIDVYNEAPRVDLLLSIFDGNAPDFFVAILDNDNATKFERDLVELGMVKHICPLVPEEQIAKMMNYKIQ